VRLVAPDEIVDGCIENAQLLTGACTAVTQRTFPYGSCRVCSRRYSADLQLPPEALVQIAKGSKLAEARFDVTPL
jgi:hypothetical protein